MKIQVFGTNCAACEEMKRNVQSAVAALGMDCEVEHFGRVLDLIEHGIAGTPALKINGQLEVVGKALSVPALKALLTECAGGDHE